MTSCSGYRSNLMSVTGGVVVLICILIFLKGRQVGHADWVGYDSIRNHNGSGNGDRTTTQPVVLKDGYSPSSPRRSPAWTKPARHRPGSSRQRQKEKARGDEFGILADDRCIDNGVFQRFFLVHELVFACSPLPPSRLQISNTFLTETDRCAVRAVARCKQGTPQSSRP